MTNDFFVGLENRMGRIIRANRDHLNHMDCQVDDGRSDHLRMGDRLVVNSSCLHKSGC